jgi:flagellar hook-length control protein FliK
MNNTSAYANVLLKPSMAAPVVTAPKRDYQDDSSPADFHQTLKDIHESQQSQNEKAYKSASSKKTTQVERHSDAKNAKDIKDIKPTHETARQQKPADDSANINQNTIVDETVREQPVQHKNKDICADKATEDKSAQEATNLVADLNPDGSQDAVIAATAAKEVNFGVTQATLTFGTELTPTTEVLVEDVSAIVNKPITAQEILVSADIGAVTAANDQVTVSSLVKSATEAEAPIEANTITLETENLASASLSPDVSAKAESRGEVVNQPLIVNESLLEKNLSQQLGDSSQVISVNQPLNPVTPADAQVLAANAMVPVAQVKPLQPQVALAEMSEASDEIIDLLTSSVTEISASAKAAQASNLAANTATNPEVTTAQVQMNASKTAFEKTLQTIITPDAGGVDDVTAAPVPSSSSASSATNPLMDSLMRGAEQQTPAARSFVVQTAVPVPVGQPQWSQAVGEKVLWLAAQNVSSAEINLHPKDLGPIQVRVSVNQEQTTVSFTSQHAVVREVLDQNLNRLRDMFSEQGLNLVNVDVSDKSFSRQQGDAQDQKGQGGSQDVASEEEAVIAMSAIVQQRLVDHYA